MGKKKTKTIPTPEPAIGAPLDIPKKMILPRYSLQIFSGLLVVLMFNIFLGNIIQGTTTSIFDRICTLVMLILFFIITVWNHFIEMRIREGL